MKKQNLKLALLGALMCMSCNAFAYKSGDAYSVTVTAQQAGTATLYTNGNVNFNEVGSVGNGQSGTVHNGEQFWYNQGDQVTLNLENYSVNGGVGLMIDVDNPLSTNSIQVVNSNTISGSNSGYLAGNYYFPDVDTNGTTLETSKVDGIGTPDIDTNGGGWVTGIGTTSSWTVNGANVGGSSSAGNGGYETTSTTISPGSVSFNYSAPSKGVVQLTTDFTNGDENYQYTITNGDGY